MHPAGSVIGFTVSSGAGYGMLVGVGVLAALGLLPTDGRIGFVAMALSLTLITGGLMSSTFHLGHPERAWRAVTQWRSSWLSREGVAAILCYLPAVALGWLWVIEGEVVSTAFRLAGGLSAFLSLATLICTAMIYRNLKPIPAWDNHYTLPGYLILGLASGLVILVAVFSILGDVPAFVAEAAFVLIVAGLVLKVLYWKRLSDGFWMPSRESATGLTFGGTVRPFEDPHSSDNYLMKEMGFQVGRKHAEKLRRIAGGAGFLVPAGAMLLAILVPAGGLQVMMSCLAIPFMTVGLVAERWLFFAEAQHVVTLYYRDRSPHPQD